jgi:hypothetical protein
LPPEFGFYGRPFLVALVVSLAFGPGTIAALKRRGVGQTISEDGPESHKPKAGTPTMGGVIIIAGILAGALAIAWDMSLVARADMGALTPHRSLLGVVVLMLGYAVLGLAEEDAEQEVRVEVVRVRRELGPELARGGVGLAHRHQRAPELGVDEGQVRPQLGRAREVVAGARVLPDRRLHGPEEQPRLGGVAVGVVFVRELTFLHGRDPLEGYDVHALISY